VIGCRAGTDGPVAVDEWLAESELREMLLRSWERTGVGLWWGCPKPDATGVVLAVVMAGQQDLVQI
jgi:hypothetical protein